MWRVRMGLHPWWLWPRLSRLACALTVGCQSIWCWPLTSPVPQELGTAMGGALDKFSAGGLLAHLWPFVCFKHCGCQADLINHLICWAICSMFLLTWYILIHLDTYGISYVNHVVETRKNKVIFEISFTYLGIPPWCTEPVPTRRRFIINPIKTLIMRWGSCIFEGSCGSLLAKVIKSYPMHNWKSASWGGSPVPSGKTYNHWFSKNYFVQCQSTGNMLAVGTTSTKSFTHYHGWLQIPPFTWDFLPQETLFKMMALEGPLLLSHHWKSAPAFPWDRFCEALVDGWSNTSILWPTYEIGDFAASFRGWSSWRGQKLGLSLYLLKLFIFWTFLAGKIMNKLKYHHFDQVW